MLLPALVFFLVLTAAGVPSVEAQEERSPLRLEVREGGEVAVHVGDLLSDPDLQEALQSGLPLRLDVVIQLWRDGFFDSQVDQARWQANIFYDALQEEYVVQMEGMGPGTGAVPMDGEVPAPGAGAGPPETDSAGGGGGDGDAVSDTGRDAGNAGPPGPGRSVRQFPSLIALRTSLPRALDPGIGPDEEGRYYYLSRLSVETLSLSDLEELRRWLRGDLAPAISGDGDVGGAAERGLRRTIIRLLGMPTRQFDARTSTFDHDPGGD